MNSINVFPSFLQLLGILSAFNMIWDIDDLWKSRDMENEFNYVL